MKTVQTEADCMSGMRSDFITESKLTKGLVHADSKDLLVRQWKDKGTRTKIEKFTMQKVQLPQMNHGVYG